MVIYSCLLIWGAQPFRGTGPRRLSRGRHPRTCLSDRLVAHDCDPLRLARLYDAHLLLLLRHGSNHLRLLLLLLLLLRHHPYLLHL